MIPQLDHKLENIPKDHQLGSFRTPALLYHQQITSRTYSKKETMAFSVGEAVTMATSEVVREEKQEQLIYSCNIAFNSMNKGAGAVITSYMSVGHKKVNKLTNPTGQDVESMEFAMLCDAMAAMDILEMGRQVQLTYSCNNIIKGAGTGSISLVFTQARGQDSIIMQPGTEGKLCAVLGAHMGT